MNIILSDSFVFSLVTFVLKFKKFTTKGAKVFTKGTNEGNYLLDISIT